MVLRRVGQLDGACHFGNMMGRLPLPARRFIWEALPETCAPLHERVAAHQWFQSWLMDNKQWVFSKESTCWCQVHEKFCYAHTVMKLEGCVPLDRLDR